MYTKQSLLDSNEITALLKKAHKTHMWNSKYICVNCAMRLSWPGALERCPFKSTNPDLYKNKECARKGVA